MLEIFLAGGNSEIFPVVLVVVDGEARFRDSTGNNFVAETGANEVPDGIDGKEKNESIGKKEEVDFTGEEEVLAIGKMAADEIEDDSKRSKPGKVVERGVQVAWIVTDCEKVFDVVIGEVFHV